MRSKTSKTKSGTALKTKKRTPYYVYIVRCTDGTLYTGITTNVVRRFNEHKDGTGARYTRARTPEKVVFTERCKNRSEASKREAAIKKLSRPQKLQLIHTR